MPNVEIRRRTAMSLLLLSSFAALIGTLALLRHAEEFRDRADRAYAGVEPAMTRTAGWEISLTAGYDVTMIIMALLDGMLLVAALLMAAMPRAGRIIAWLSAPPSIVLGALPALNGYEIVLARIRMQTPRNVDTEAAMARLRSDVTWLHTGAWHVTVVAAGWVMAVAPMAAGVIAPGRVRPAKAG